MSYDPDASALFARFTTPPTTARKALINTAIVDLKDAGVWDKLDALYLTAAADAQAARMNWIEDQYNLTVVASPTFTVDRGYTGDGSAAYLDTGFNPSTAVSPNFVQDSGHISVWSRSAGQENAVVMGNANTLLQVRNTGDVFGNRVNAAASNQVPNTDGAGHFVSSRTGASNTVPYIDGAAQTLAPTASVTVDTNAIRILGRSGTVSYSPREVASGSIGAGLTGQNVSDLYSALNTYLQAVGAV